MQVGYLRVAAETVKAARAAKRIALGKALKGEEWFLSPSRPTTCLTERRTCCSGG